MMSPYVAECFLHCSALLSAFTIISLTLTAVGRLRVVGFLGLGASYRVRVTLRLRKIEIVR